MATHRIYKEQIEDVFVLKSVYNLDMANKANIDGSNTIGGVWQIDNIFSNRFTGAKGVFNALSGNIIEWGNADLVTHRFLANNINALKVKVGSAEYNVYHSGNLINVSQLNNNAGYLQANDLDGFAYDVIYNGINHQIIIYRQNRPNIVIDLPIESLIKGVALVGNNLVFTFEDGSTASVPLNTLLVGVVKFVNGKAPNSLGEVILQITDIPSLSSELANKANISGYYPNLWSGTADNAIRWNGQPYVNTGNVTPEYFMTLQNDNWSYTTIAQSKTVLGIDTINTQLSNKANINGSNIPANTYWATFTSHKSKLLTDNVTGLDYGLSMSLSGNPAVMTGLIGGSSQYPDAIVQYNKDAISGFLGLSNYALLTQVYTRAQSLALFVGLNGAQTISDTKTFTHSPVVPNATLNAHSVNLGQILGFNYTTLSAVQTWINSQGFAPNNGFDYIQTGGSQTIQPTATKTTIAIQGSNVTISLQGGVNDGDECSITSCGDQQYYVAGSIIGKCGDNPREAQTSTLWWWHKNDNVWYQAI